MPQRDHRIGRRSTYNAEIRDRVAQMYLDEELTQQEIAEQVGVTRSLVGRWLRDVGVKARPKRRANAWRRKQLTLLEIAAELWNVQVTNFEMNEAVNRYEEVLDGRAAARDARRRGEGLGGAESSEGEGGGSTQG